MAELSNASYRRGLADGADEEAPVRDSDEDYLRGYAEGRLDPARAQAHLRPADARLREVLDVAAARQRGRADALELRPRREWSEAYDEAYAEVARERAGIQPAQQTDRRQEGRGFGCVALGCLSDVRGEDSVLCAEHYERWSALDERQRGRARPQPVPAPPAPAPPAPAPPAPAPPAPAPARAAEKCVALGCLSDRRRVAETVEALLCAEHHERWCAGEVLNVRPPPPAPAAPAPARHQPAPAAPAPARHQPAPAAPAPAPAPAPEPDLGSRFTLLEVD